VRARIKRPGETGAIKALIPKDCCDWECETYQAKYCTDRECTDYNPSTGECANWKCNEWVACTKERCRCIELYRIMRKKRARGPAVPFPINGFSTCP